MPFLCSQLVASVVICYASYEAAVWHADLLRALTSFSFSFAEPPLLRTSHFVAGAGGRSHVFQQVDADEVEEVTGFDRPKSKAASHDLLRAIHAPDEHDFDPSGVSLQRFDSQRPALDVFVERFVDAFSPEVDIKSGRAGAIRAAAEIRMFSPLISDAFEAVSVAFFGRSIQDKRIESGGFRLYPRVLRGLQEALKDPERSKAESTLVTVILLMAFEVRLLFPYLFSFCSDFLSFLFFRLLSLC